MTSYFEAPGIRGGKPPGPPPPAPPPPRIKNDAGSIRNLQRDVDAAMTEAQWLAEVIALADRLGWMVHHVFEQANYARRTDTGYPDLTLVRDRIVFAELKSNKRASTVRPSQQQWLDKLTTAGGEAYVWRPSDRPEVERTLTRMSKAPRLEVE